MNSVPNYQELLAETYQENAKNLLLEYEDYGEEQVLEGYAEKEYSDYKVSDPDKFNRFQGDRGVPENVVQVKPVDKGKGTVKRDTDVRNVVLNIDSSFRSNAVPTSTDGTTAVSQTSWFLFGSSRIYKNISSVKLTSVEFPNTFYSFSASRGNTSFTLTINQGQYLGTYQVVIPDGNYQNSNEVLTLDPTTLIQTIQSEITTSVGNGGLGITGFTITYNDQTQKITFSFNASFTITFPESNSNVYKNGIGYNLGFYKQSYTSTALRTNQITSDILPDAVQDKYIYIQINDWNLIDRQDMNQTSYPVFAKIQLPGTKNTIIFDSNYINSTTKEYFFQQPINIQKMEIKLLDALGNVIDTNGENWSMTLELKQVNDFSTYEELNRL
jgi:hypothetical protein